MRALFIKIFPAYACILFFFRKICFNFLKFYAFSIETMTVMMRRLCVSSIFISNTYVYLSIVLFFSIYFEYSFWFYCGSPRCSLSCSCSCRCTIASSPCPQVRALRLVIDVGFSIIYCYILRLHLNPLMA